MGMDRQIKKKKWPPKKIALVASSVIFVAAVVYLFLFEFSEAALNVETDRITVSTVEKGPFQEYISVMGNCLPIYTYELNASEGGRVEVKYVEAGAIVRLGDPILKLANTNLLTTVMWREADFYQQSNNLRATRLSMEQYRLTLSKEMADIDSQFLIQERLYNQQKELIKDKLISENEFIQTKNQYEYLVKRKELAMESQKNELTFRQAQLDSLESAVNQMQTNLRVVREQLDNLTIKAPVAGLLSALNAEIGQFKGPSDRLGQIDVLEGFKVRAGIDEHYITRVEVGKPGEFDLASASYDLTVKKIYPEVVEGKFNVDLEFSDKVPPDLRRGQTLHIKLYLSDTSEAILLAKGGFYETTGGNWVYILDPSGKFAVKRSIRIGRQNIDRFEVLEGLQPGEKVVTSSYESYNNIDKLILK